MIVFVTPSFPIGEGGIILMSQSFIGTVFAGMWTASKGPTILFPFFTSTIIMDLSTVEEELFKA